MDIFALKLQDEMTDYHWKLQGFLTDIFLTLHSGFFNENLYP